MKVLKSFWWAPLAALAWLAASCASPIVLSSDSGPTSRALVPPYTSYEAEGGTYTGALAAADRTYHTVASEASGRQHVSLTATGQYVQWTAATAANALNLRYSIPDSGSGGGTSATLSLYVNGTKTQTLSLSSAYAWVYGDSVNGTVWYSNTPGSNPHRFFDQSHFLLSSSIPAGATVRLQKDSGDSASFYHIDLIDLENVPAALSQPAGSVSITSHGAVANDAGDDTAAFNAAVVAAGSGGTVWIPTGTFLLGTRPTAFPHNITVQGAGMWRSVLQGVGASFTPNAKTIKFYDFQIDGATKQRDDAQLQAGIDAGGNGFGTGSVVQRVWFRHLKVGVWTGPGTTNLTIDSCRIWDVFADGVNLYKGTNNSTVSNTSVRNSGDDGLAIWSGEGQACYNNTLRDNLVQFPNHANGIAVYGGYGNAVQNNTVTDVVQYGSGIYLANRFGIVPFTGTTTVTGNVIERSGSYDPDYGYADGAIRLHGAEGDMNATFVLTNNTVTSPTYSGVQFIGGGLITGVTFGSLTVSNPGTYGVEVRSNARGSATFSNSSYGTLNNAAGANFTVNAAGGTPIVPYLQINGGVWQQTANATINPGDTVVLGPQPSTGGTWSWTGGGTSGTSRQQTIAPTSSVTATASYNDGSGVITTQIFTITVVAPQPDLVVTAVTWSPANPAAGQAVTFSATVQNQGAGATPGSVVHGIGFKVDGTTVTWSDTRTASLAAGASVTLSANGGVAGATWAATGGFHTVQAFVDDVNRIAESNEGNNTRDAALTVSGGSGQPDLVVTAITWSPTNPTTGQAVTFSATIKNQGTGPSPAGVKHGVAFSINGAQGPWIDNYNTSLAAGASVTITANGGPSGATWSAVSGTHTIGAAVDDQGLISESSEGNNSFSASLTVGSGGGGGGFPVAGTWYKILNRQSGRALEIGGQTTADGAGASQWDYLSQGNQKWQFVATDSGYYRMVVQNSGKALDVDGASTADGAKVQQWTYAGGPNQQWKVVDLGGGYYRIEARHDAKSLGVVGASSNNGALVSQYSYSGINSQQWSIVTAN